MTGYPAPDIYHRLHGGDGSGSWQQTEAFSGEQKTLQDSINQQVLDLNNQMNTAWQGDAATQAVSGAMPLATATNTAGSSLATAQSTISSQVGAFHTAYNSVVQMPASAPPNNALNQVETFFGANTDLDKQIAQYQADGSHNVQVYNTYTAASNETAANMPTDYGTLPQASPDVTVAAPGVSSGGGGGYGGSSGPAGSGGGYSGSYSGSSGASGYSGNLGTANPGGGGNSSIPNAEMTGPSGPTTLSDYPNGPTTTGPTGLPLDEGPGFPGGGPLGGLNGPGNGSDTPYGSNPYGLGGLGGMNEPEGFGGGAGGLGGSGGSGSGLGGAGGATGEGASTGSGRAGLGSGNSSAMNPAAAEEAMARGGMAGEPGAGGMGRGRGKKGEEDLEHKTAEYLQEPDPDAIFGTDQMTVPPVIG